MTKEIRGPGEDERIETVLMVTVVLRRGRKQTIVYQITDPQGADPRSFRMTLPQTL